MEDENTKDESNKELQDEIKILKNRITVLELAIAEAGVAYREVFELRAVNKLISQNNQ